MTEPTPRTVVITRGKYYGEPIANVPARYLRWMVREQHTNAAEAQAELERRAAEEQI